MYNIVGKWKQSPITIMNSFIYIDGHEIVPSLFIWFTQGYWWNFHVFILFVAFTHTKVYTTAKLMNLYVMLVLPVPLTMVIGLEVFGIDLLLEKSLRFLLHGCLCALSLFLDCGCLGLGNKCTSPVLWWF